MLKLKCLVECNDACEMLLVSREKKKKRKRKKQSEGQKMRLCSSIKYNITTICYTGCLKKDNVYQQKAWHHLKGKLHVWSVTQNELD